MINQFRRYFKDMKKGFIVKLMMSLFLSLLGINLFTVITDKFVLFMVLSIVNYIGIEVTYTYLSKTSKSIMDELSNYMFALQDEVNDSEHLSPHKKRMIDIMILTMIDIFIAKVINIRFLKYSFYNPETEYSNFLTYISQAFDIYQTKWVEMGISDFHISKFNKINDKMSERYINEMRDLIFSDLPIIDIQDIFMKKTKLLISSTVMEMISQPCKSTK